MNRPRKKRQHSATLIPNSLTCRKMRTPKQSSTSCSKSARQHFGKDKLRDWFKALYETLLGSSQGPRMGSFIALYGIDNSRRLIEESLAS